MSEILKMFEHEGKTTKVIGKSRTKIYKSIYNHLSSMQGKDLPVHENYLGDNELAETIYAQKYYLKSKINFHTP